jgi:uncharacterized membrane protein
MAGNFLLGIIPSQRAFVDAVTKGEAPDPSFGAFAKLRSTHNNYFTLPLLFIMISNHYPMTYTHEYNWLALSAICLITAFSRHFFQPPTQRRIQTHHSAYLSYHDSHFGDFHGPYKNIDPG